MKGAIDQLDDGANSPNVIEGGNDGGGPLSVDGKGEVKKAKLETKVLKAKRPGFTDERYNKTSKDGGGGAPSGLGSMGDGGEGEGRGMKGSEDDHGGPKVCMDCGGGGSELREQKDRKTVEKGMNAGSALPEREERQVDGREAKGGHEEAEEGAVGGIDSSDFSRYPFGQQIDLPEGYGQAKEGEETARYMICMSFMTSYSTNHVVFKQVYRTSFEKGIQDIKPQRLCVY